jgi:hypothetical protein
MLIFSYPYAQFLVSEQVVEKIERQREVLDCDVDVLAIVKYGGMTDREAHDSMRLFADEVMPAIRSTPSGGTASRRSA